jgi:hypothetical protein
MDNTRVRHSQIASAARASFGRLGLDPLRVAPDDYDSVAMLIDDIVSEVDCTRETARRHVNRILRERDNHERATWGGKRYGAGRHGGENCQKESEK